MLSMKMRYIPLVILSLLACSLQPVVAGDELIETKSRVLWSAVLGEETNHYDYVSSGVLKSKELIWVASRVRSVDDKESRLLKIWVLGTDGNIKSEQTLNTEILVKNNGNINIQYVYLSDNEEIFVVFDGNDHYSSVAKYLKGGDLDNIYDLGRKGDNRRIVKIDQKKNGHFLMAGYTNKYALILEQDADWNVLWEYRVDNADIDIVTDFFQSSGSIYILGGSGRFDSDIFGGFDKVWVHKIDEKGAAVATHNENGQFGGITLGLDHEIVFIFDKDLTLAQDIWVNTLNVEDLSVKESKFVIKTQKDGVDVDVSNSSSGLYSIVGSQGMNLWAICLDDKFQLKWEYVESNGRGIRQHLISIGDNDYVISPLIGWNKEVKLNYKIRVSALAVCNT